MEIESVKGFIKSHIPYLSPVMTDALTAKRYYECENDILLRKKDDDKKEKQVMRNADNRVCSSWYPLLVDQKTAYTFTYPPLFDVGNSKNNKKIKAVLGDKFPKRCQTLCRNATNDSVSWIHYWQDKKGQFRYGVLSGTQVIPVISDDIEEELMGVIRTYRRTEHDGKTYIIYEIWNDNCCESYRCEENLTIDAGLHAFNMFEITDNLTGSKTPTSVYNHDFGVVPFIPFYNNSSHKGDLKRIKGLIDTYDKTFNGFANDLEDIQEVIMVLSGYSGTSLSGFLEDLKKYKVIKIDDKESGGVSTLNIDIPVEARREMLELTKKAIFIQGQGVDPDPEKFGDTSGVALQFLYSLLELKAGAMETEFRAAFSELVRAICRFYSLSIKDDVILQTWTRNAIRNDKEQAEIANSSTETVSQKTALANHPFVDDVEAELSQLDKEKKALQAENDVYNTAFNNQNTDEGDDEE